MAKETKDMEKIWVCEKRKLKDLLPNEDNPRRISQAKLEKLQSQIQRLGFHNPPKVDNDGVIIGGNQRYKALMEIGGGELEIPVMIPQFKLTKKEREEIIITDNISDGDWDLEKLELDFDTDELNKWGLDIDFGISGLMDELEDGAFSDKINSNSETFAVSFSFPKEYEPEIQEAIKKVGKSAIVDQILNFLDLELGDGDNE